MNKQPELKSIHSINDIFPFFDFRLKDFVLNKNDYLGVVNIGCGFYKNGIKFSDFECYTDFVFVKNSICYVYFGGSELDFIKFFPFKI